MFVESKKGRRIFPAAFAREFECFRMRAFCDTQKGAAHAVPFWVISVLVESELEADRRAIVQVDFVAISVASGQVAGGKVKLPSGRPSTV